MGSVNLCLALWSSVNEVPSGIVFALFETGTGQRLFPRRMPSFFLVLLERLGISMAVSVGVLSGLVIKSRTSIAIRSIRYPWVSAPVA